MCALRPSGGGRDSLRLPNLAGLECRRFYPIRFAKQRKPTPRPGWMSPAKIIANQVAGNRKPAVGDGSWTTYFHSGGLHRG